MSDNKKLRIQKNDTHWKRLWHFEYEFCMSNMWYSRCFEEKYTWIRPCLVFGCFEWYVILSILPGIDLAIVIILLLLFKSAFLSWFTCRSHFATVTWFRGIGNTKYSYISGNIAVVPATRVLASPISESTWKEQVNVVLSCRLGCPKYIGRRHFSWLRPCGRKFEKVMTFFSIGVLSLLTIGALSIKKFTINNTMLVNKLRLTCKSGLFYYYC